MTSKTPKVPPAKGSGKKPQPERAAISVVGPKSGRRRAGRTFGPTSVKIWIDDLKKGEAKALRDDPKLTVTPIEPDAD